MVNKHFMFVFIQVYRVSDMELVRVLPSAEDEVNVACFHPSVGGGLVYGTKVKTNGFGIINTALSSFFNGCYKLKIFLYCDDQEGRLRILQYDSSPHSMNHPTCGFLDENMLEVKSKP